MRFVPALLKPLDFWHSDEALFLVQRLEQTSNDWQNLALATSGYQSWKNANPWSSIEKYIAVCLAKRELLVFKINPVNVKIERLQFNNPYGLSYRFLPAYYRLTHSALPLKRITDLTKAHSLVQSLNLSDKQFNELIETLSISPPASTNTAKPIDLLCKAIISGAVIIHEREAVTTSKPLVEEPLGPNDRPSTMGVEPYDPAKAYQEKQAKANQPIPLSERKGLPPASLDDAAKRLESMKQLIKDNGYQPKYTDEELMQQAQLGDVAQERFHVRVMKKGYRWNPYDKVRSEENLTGALGTTLEGSTGKGAKYWSTTFDQIEDADQDPRLINEKLGISHQEGAEFLVVIIDTEQAIPLTGVKSVPATFEKVGEFANVELPKSFPEAFTNQVMNEEYQALYAQHHRAAVESKVMEEWDTKPEKFERYLNTTNLSEQEKKLMQKRLLMHNKVGNNQYYEGNGLTKNLIADSNNQYGSVETLNFERKEINLQQLKEVGAIQMIELG